MRDLKKWLARWSFWGLIPSIALLYGGLSMIAIGGSIWYVSFVIPMALAFVGGFDGYATHRAYRELNVVMYKIMKERYENQGTTTEE